MNDNGRHEFDLTPEGRIAYLESLSESFEPWVDHSPIFIAHLDHEDPQVRAAAVRGLWDSPDPSLIDRLIGIADKDPSPEVRAAAIGGLGIYIHEGVMAGYDLESGLMTDLIEEDELTETDFERVQAYLLGVFSDQKRTPEERRSAVEAVSFLTEPEVVEVIENAYQQPEREWKISALFAMGRSGMGRWADVLAQELHNPDQEIQLFAIRAVGEIGLAELGKDLWRLTYAEDKDVVLEAIEALGQTGWSEAFERLEELTAARDPDIAQVAEEALDEWLLMSELTAEDDDLDSDLLDWDDND